MENTEYNRLIRENKLDELLERCYFRLEELIIYKYLGKYILEYLLEKNIHNLKMDNLAKSNSIWINLYLKYNILEPLTESYLKELLIIENGELLLDKLLKVLNNRQKIKLYNSFKKQNYWLFMNNEQLIIKSFYKVGLKIPSLFINTPFISCENVVACDEFNRVLEEFKTVYHDIDSNSLDAFVNELKRRVKIDHFRTINDIKILIDYKKRNAGFKLITKNNTIEDGSIGSFSIKDNELVIEQYRKGVFNHELSHMLYDYYEYEIEPDFIGYLNEYKHLQKDIKANRKEEITNYLKKFHNRSKNMAKIFREIYLSKVERKYGSMSDYILDVALDIEESGAEYITIDKNETMHYLTEDNLLEGAKDLVKSECQTFVDKSVINYYTEELFLENLLDAILDGAVYDGKCHVKSYSGHGKKYFDEDIDQSFDEALANFDAIKNSYRNHSLTNKLREIVGDEMVDLLEECINVRRRREKTYMKKKDNYK